jgi:trigger factor
MKLKFTALFLSAVLLMLFITGCADNNKLAGEETTGTSSDTVNLTDNKYEAYDLAEYVTLGQYTGVQVAKQDPTVTDQQYTDYIAKVLSDNKSRVEVTDRAAQQGDTLQIDYVGNMTNIATPEGMTAKGQEIVIGAGSFIPGFEDGLIGAKKGDVVTISVTFPDPYTSNETLSGPPATFTVTVNAIYKDVTPELSDDFVKSISEYKTVDEYKSSVMLKLYSDNVAANRSTQMGELWKAIMDSSTIIKYPETETKAYSDEMIKYYTDYAANNGYDSLEAMLTAVYSTTLDAFNTQAATYAQNTVAEEMVLYSIVNKEELYLTQAEYDTAAAEYMTKYKYDTVTALETYYGRDVLIRSILWDKTLDYLLGQAVIA